MVLVGDSFGLEVGGVAFLSCYFIPNEGIHEFHEKLDRLKIFCGNISTGDFNAKMCIRDSINTRGRLTQIEGSGTLYFLLYFCYRLF